VVLVDNYKCLMRRNGDRGLVGGDQEILDRGYGFHRTGDRWLPDRWLGMPGQIVIPPGGGGLADGDPVTAWGDSSQAAYNATAVGAACPTYKTGGPNSKPVVRFTAAQEMTLATGPNSMHPWTSFVVWKPVVGETAFALRGTNSAFTGMLRNDGYYMAHCNTGQTYQPPAGFGSAFHVYAVRTGPVADHKLWVDGAASTMVALGGGGMTGNFDRIGGGGGGSDIAEIVHYSGRTLSDAEILNISKNLGTKYGIAVAGGTDVSPIAVPGLGGWWKADSMTPAPAFDPMQIPGILGWWKAETLLPLADSALIASWTDSSGKGRHATSTVAPANAPYFANNVGGSGKPGVVYDGNPRWLAFSPKILANGVPVSVVAVMWNSGHLMGLTSVAGYNACCMPRIYTGDGHLLNQVNGQMWYSNAMWIGGTWTVYTCTSKPSSFTNGVGGDAIGSLLAATPGDLDAMGSENASGQIGFGYHGEVIAYDHVLTDSERVPLEDYLKRKYGIAGVGLLDYVEQEVRQKKREIRREIIKRGLGIVTLPGPEVPEE
jgi:hypothetical protein